MENIVKAYITINTQDKHKIERTLQEVLSYSPVQATLNFCLLYTSQLDLEHFISIMSSLLNSPSSNLSEIEIGLLIHKNLERLRSARDGEGCLYLCIDWIINNYSKLTVGNLGSNLVLAILKILYTLAYNLRWNHSDYSKSTQDFSQEKIFYLAIIAKLGRGIMEGIIEKTHFEQLISIYRRESILNHIVLNKNMLTIFEGLYAELDQTTYKEVLGELDCLCMEDITSTAMTNHSDISNSYDLRQKNHSELISTVYSEWASMSSKESMPLEEEKGNISQERDTKDLNYSPTESYPPFEEQPSITEPQIPIARAVSSGNEQINRIPNNDCSVSYLNTTLSATAINNKSKGMMSQHLGESLGYTNSYKFDENVEDQSISLDQTRSGEGLISQSRAIQPGESYIPETIRNTSVMEETKFQHNFHDTSYLTNSNFPLKQQIPERKDRALFDQRIIEHYKNNCRPYPKNLGDELMDICLEELRKKSEPVYQIITEDTTFSHNIGFGNIGIINPQNKNEFINIPANEFCYSIHVPLILKRLEILSEFEQKLDIHGRVQLHKDHRKGLQFKQFSPYIEFKIEDRKHQIYVNNQEAEAFALIISKYMEFNDKYPIILYAIYKWAIHYDILNYNEGGLSFFSLCFMLIFVLQKLKLVPPLLHENFTGGKLRNPFTVDGNCIIPQFERMEMDSKQPLYKYKDKRYFRDFSIHTTFIDKLKEVTRVEEFAFDNVEYVNDVSISEILEEFFNFYLHYKHHKRILSIREGRELDMPNRSIIESFAYVENPIFHDSIDMNHHIKYDEFGSYEGMGKKIDEAMKHGINYLYDLIQYLLQSYNQI